MKLFFFFLLTCSPGCCWRREGRARLISHGNQRDVEKVGVLQAFSLSRCLPIDPRVWLAFALALIIHLFREVPDELPDFGVGGIDAFVEFIFRFVAYAEASIINGRNAKHPSTYLAMKRFEG